MEGIHRVARRPRLEIGKFSADSFAEDKRSCIAQARDTTGLRPIQNRTWELGACPSWETMHVKEILDSEQDPIEGGTPRRVRVSLLQAGCFSAQSLAPSFFGQQGLKLWLGSLDPVTRFLNRSYRLFLTTAKPLC